MKLKLSSFLLMALFAGNCFSARATVILTFESGNIQQSPGVNIPIGSLAVLVADKNGDGFATTTSITGSTLSVGNSLGGTDNEILRTFNAFDLGGLIGFADTFSINYSGALNQGDAFALFWFPTLSTVGASVNGGTSYGFYRTDLVDAVSGSNIDFHAPVDGFSYTLAAYDNSNFPGAVASQLDLTAALTAVAVPEPATYVLFVAGFAGLAAFRRRRQAAA
jgi:hypothetical protein